MSRRAPVRRWTATTVGLALLVPLAVACSEAEPEGPLATAGHEFATSLPADYLALSDSEVVSQAAAADALLVDVREPAEYSDGHLPGAINVPLRAITRDLGKIPTDREVIVYCRTGYRSAVALTALGLLGYDQVRSFQPGFVGWQQAGWPVSTDLVPAEQHPLPQLPAEMFTAVDEFLTAIPADGHVAGAEATDVAHLVTGDGFVLDVREPDEYAAGRLPGAVNLPLRELVEKLSTIPTDQPVLVYCRSSHRAAIALVLLHVLGRDTTVVFTGGYEAWTYAGGAIES